MLTQMPQNSFAKFTQRDHKENQAQRCRSSKKRRPGSGLTALPYIPFPTPAFERGHCYEPYLQNGNFSTTDPLYGVGAVVQFACDPGHSLEQGPPVIECISARDPYWNDTEPLCKGITQDVDA